MLYMGLCSFMMFMALSEMIRTMTAIGNGSFAGNRFIPLALVLLTLALASPFFATFYTLSRPVSIYHGGRSQHLTTALDQITDSAMRLDLSQKP